jgi:hypothetical protein
VSEQDVLRADEAARPEPRLLLREDEDPASSIRESLEHGPIVPDWSSLALKAVDDPVIS